MHSSTMSGMFSDSEERGQNSRGTPIVAPSGICGCEGELGELPWMRLNCLTTFRRHVVGLLGDDGGSPGRLGLRVFDTGEWPVGDRLRCNVKRPIRRWLEPCEFSISWAWRTRIISLLLYPPADGWTSSLSLDCSCFIKKKKKSRSEGRIIINCLIWVLELCWDMLLIIISVNTKLMFYHYELFSYCVWWTMWLILYVTKGTTINECMNCYLSWLWSSDIHVRSPLERILSFRTCESINRCERPTTNPEPVSKPSKAFSKYLVASIVSFFFFTRVSTTI